jgi:hypothetical protein
MLNTPFGKTAVLQAIWGYRTWLWLVVVSAVAGSIPSLTLFGMHRNAGVSWRLRYAQCW